MKTKKPSEIQRFHSAGLCWCGITIGSISLMTMLLVVWDAWKVIMNYLINPRTQPNEN